MKFNPSKRTIRFLKIMVVLALMGVWYWWVYIYNPLISDERLIANFKSHREEFEELVRSYRYFNVMPGVSPTSAWLKDTRTEELMNKTSIYYISQLAPNWIPKPYSDDARKRYLKLKKGKKYFLEFKRIYGSIALHPLYGTRSRNEAIKNTLFFGVIWKDYEHFPEEPLVKDGWLYWPATRSGYQPKDRVLDSLDDIPRDWKTFECVYRRLDRHWFLRMCNGH